MSDLQNATFRVLGDEPEQQASTAETTATETVSTESTKQATAATTENTEATQSTPTENAETVQTEQQNTPPTPAPEINREEFYATTFKEKTGFDSLDELQAHIEEQAKQKAYASEEVKSYNDWIAKGLPKEKYFQVQALDVDSMSDLDKVRQHYTITKPKLTPDQVERLIRKNFPMNEEEFDEDTIELAKIELMDAAETADRELRAWKVKESTPKQDETANQTAQAQQAWESDLQANLPKYKQLEVAINDKGEKINYDVDVQSIEQTLKNPAAFWQKFTATDAQGNNSINWSTLVEVMAYAENPQKFKAAIAAQSKGSGVEEVKAEIKNPSASQESRVAESQTKEQKLGAAIAQSGLFGFRS